MPPASAWLLALPAFAAAAGPPYLGQWSNGRGETLAITNSTIRFADDRPVPYRDLTRATDGSIFELQITASDRVNAFDGKFLFVSCEGERMRITSYASHAELAQERNPGSEITWFRDDEKAGDDDGEDE